jgi:hypothetical protein
LAWVKRCITLYLLNSYDLYPPGASRDPTFGVSGWVSSGGFGNLIGGDSGFAVELAGGADGSSEFIRYILQCNSAAGPRRLYASKRLFGRF